MNNGRGSSTTGVWWVKHWAVMDGWGPTASPPPSHLPSASGLPHPETQNAWSRQPLLISGSATALSSSALLQHIPLDDLASWRDFCLLFVCLSLAFACLCFASHLHWSQALLWPCIGRTWLQACSLLPLMLQTTRMRWIHVSWISSQFPRGCVFQFVQMNSRVYNHTVYYKSDNWFSNCKIVLCSMCPYLISHLNHWQTLMIILFLYLF